ncbi:MAG TPA: L-seryl-tRNA(Sec) selenium transferase, partial [Hyphomicrobiaceae bacterium]|nr:L-seryl-tRNA(Sec) selenium transferase [Hyphomicrobiaceae bacterium]
AGIAIRPTPGTREGSAVQALADAFRNLPVPVIGRIHDGALFFDLRCLDDDDALSRQLAELEIQA